MIDLLNCLIDTNLKAVEDKDFNRVAKIHKYWSRKPFHLVESCIQKYSKEGDLVVDPFCGSGSTGIESILNGRRYIGYDLNPTAIFVSHCTLTTSFIEKEFLQEVEKLKKGVFNKIMNLYKVAQGRFIVYCMANKNVNDYNAVISDKSFLDKQKVQLNDKCIHPEVQIPLFVSYPDEPFPKKFYKDRFSYKGIHNVSDMFTPRNLYALAILYNYIKETPLKYKDFFILAFSNTLLHASKLKSENVRPLSVNNYWVPDDFIEENVIWRYLDRISNIVKAKEQIIKKSKGKDLDNQYELRNCSSIFLDEIEDESVDYIITDPPYGETIQYSELSFIWNCWLGKAFDINQEVIINPVQKKGIDDFKSQMASFIKSTYRVLKPNAAFTLCFQNKDPHIWIDIVNSVKEAGFGLDDIKIYDTFGSPYNKHWSKFSPKADLYVTFKKTNFVVDNQTPVNTETILDRVVELCRGAALNNNKCYDLFVAAVIDAVFDGMVITDIKDWTLKRIVTTYEEKFRAFES